MPDSTRRIAVIGGGPGGYVAALRAAQLGACVTLVERDKLGGTCLHRGCIPTKALLHTASLYAACREGQACGVHAEVRLDFAAAQAHKEGLVHRLAGGIKGLLAAARVEVVPGHARFAGSKTLHITTPAGVETRVFDAVIIASGSEPAMPPIPGLDAPQCVDSTGALGFDQVPARLVIIGGGVIGVEIACLYAALGSKVQVVEMLPAILPAMDAGLSRVLAGELRNQGITLLTSSCVTAIHDTGSLARLDVQTPEGMQTLTADKVLVAVGRKARISDLELQAAGIGHDRLGIAVNERLETSVPGVYAIGDCTGGAMLAHVASAQGEVAAENAMGQQVVFSAATNPSCVYTTPEFAGVGLTEEAANDQGIDCKVGVFPLAANGKALIMNGGVGVIKVLAGAEHGEILGVHMVGPRATDLIAEAALAIGLEATLDEVAATIHAHPTLAEAFREAVLAVTGRAVHLPGVPASTL